MKSPTLHEGAGRILVCFALKEEAAPFQKLSWGKNSIFILLTGIGRANSEKAIRQFLANHSPSVVFTCGFAGGLNPALAAGAVVFSTADNLLGTQLLAAGAQPGKMFCAARIATTAAEKQTLRTRTGADVVEMESEIIQMICREREIPCAIVRVISDTAEEDLPLNFNELSKPDLNLDYRKLAWAIAKNPGKIAALMRLQKRCQSAANNLADVLSKVIFR